MPHFPVSEHRYRARSEIFVDAVEVFYHIFKDIKKNQSGISIYNFKLDDNLLWFSSNAPYDAIQKCFFKTVCKIPDTHVLIETLAYESDYTGERKDIHIPSEYYKCKTCKKQW